MAQAVSRLISVACNSLSKYILIGLPPWGFLDFKSINLTSPKSSKNRELIVSTWIIFWANEFYLDFLPDCDILPLLSNRYPTTGGGVHMEFMLSVTKSDVDVKHNKCHKYIGI